MDHPSHTPHALDELIAQRHWAQALARSLLGDGSRADDVAQDALVLALDRGRAPSGDARAWLTATVKRLVRHVRRGDARRRERERHAARGEQDTSHEITVRRAELQQELARAVLALPEPFRTTILLRYLEELDVDVVAARTGVPPATVRTRTARGLELLRLRCGARDGGPALHGLTLLAGAFDPASPAGIVSSPVAPVAVSASLAGTLMKVTAALAALVLVVLALPIASRTLAPGGEPASSLASTTTPGTTPAVIDAPAEAPRTAVATSLDAPDAREAARLQGRLLVGFDRAVPEADVFLFDEPLVRPFEDARSDLRAVARTRSGPDGSFVLDGLDATHSYDLVAQHGGLPAARRTVRPGDLGVWQLPLAARVRGRVLDAETQAPIAGAELTFASARVVQDGYSAVRSVTADADGRFEIEGVAAGTPVSVSVAPPGALGFLATIDVAAPGAVERDLVVQGITEFAGTLVDHETRAPIAGAVLCRAAAGARLAETDPRGHFRIRVANGADATNASPRIGGEVRPGSHAAANAAQLEFHAPGWCVGRASLAQAPRDSAGELVLPLLRASRLTGIVLDARGAPVEGALLGFGARPAVRWLDTVTARSGSALRTLKTGADGRFTFEDVPSGIDATLVVRRGTRAPLEIGDALPRASGETRELVVRVE